MTRRASRAAMGNAANRKVCRSGDPVGRTGLSTASGPELERSFLQLELKREVGHETQRKEGGYPGRRNVQ